MRLKAEGSIMHSAHIVLITVSRQFGAGGSVLAR
jgi:hypothetical protein